MPDRIVKPDSGNDLVLQNDDGSAKIEINEDATVNFTGTIPSIQVDNIKVDGNTITSEDTNGNIALTPNGTGEVDISKVDIDSGTIDGATIATSDVTVGAGKTLNVSAGSLTTSTAQKQAIVQAGPGSGTIDVSSGTFTSSTAQKQAIVDGATVSVEAANLSTSSGTTIPNAIQDNITRLGTVTSGTFNATLGSSIAFPAGMVLQTLSKTDASTADYTSDQETLGGTGGLEIMTIAPKQTNSKYLVTAVVSHSWGGSYSTTAPQIATDYTLKIKRGVDSSYTFVGGATNASSRGGSNSWYGNDDATLFFNPLDARCWVVMYLDSPSATTSENVSYQIGAYGSFATLFSYNKVGGGTSHGVSASTLTIQEIAV